MADDAPVTSNSAADSEAAKATLEGKAMNASEFAVAMAVGDMFEIDSARLALQRAQSADVRKFAHMMLDNHTQSGNRPTAEK